MRHLISRLAWVLALAAALPGLSSAAPLTWTGAASMNWNETDSNWGGPLWSSATPDSAVFGATGVGMVTLTTHLTANTLTFNSAGYTIVSNTLTLGGTGPLITNSADAKISSVLAGTAGLNKSGNGTLTLSGANTFTGNINLGAGNIRITRAAGLGAGAKTMTISASLTKMLELDGSSDDIFLPDTIDFSTSGAAGVIRNLAGDNTIAGSFTMTLGNGNTKLISDGGSLKLTGNITAANSSRALDLSGSSTGDNLFSGVLDNANTPAVLKTGAGTWTMSGFNTYAGATTINAGKLVMATSGSCSNSAVSLAATSGNSATLGVSTMNPSRTWACASLTVNNAGTRSDLEFNFVGVAPSLTVAPLKVLGAATFTTRPAVTVRAGGNLDGKPGTQYSLMTWASASGLTPTNVTVSSVRPVTGHLLVSGNTLYLVIDANGNAPIRWAASGAGVWNTNTPNWKDSGGAVTAYQEPGTSGDAVIFDETYLAANTTVTLTNTVTPSGISVSNATSNYTITGSGGIAGGTGLTKQGAGKLTLNTTNTFVGNVTVNGGTLAVTGNGRLYYGSANETAVVTVNAGATLELDKWWMHNDDSLGLLGNGPEHIVVNGGTIRMNGVTGYGRGVTVNGSATFETAAGADWFIHDFNGTAAFVYNSNPTLIFTGAGIGHFWKAITGGCSVLKRGPGMWSLLGEGNTYTGNALVEQGVLRVMRATLSDTATVILQRGGILDLWHDNTDKVGALVINGVTMPPGTYNRTTHPEYFFGRGSLIVGGAAATGPTALTYYTSGEENWPAGKETAITNSMNGCLSYYNAYGTYGRLGGNIKIQYSSSVPTAQASQGGPITFGGSISTHTAIHEMAHVMGTGTAWQWDYHRASGQWLGPHANNLVYQIDHSRSIGCDPAHFWPYNINYANEDSTKARQVSPMVVAAMRRDMGIFNDPPTISTVADQVVSTNMSTGPIPFLIGDPDTAVSSLNVTVFSSNTNLVPVNNIFISGTGTNRTVTVTPTASLGGSAVITLSVMDGEWATPTSFTVSIGTGAPTAYHWLVGNGTWDTVTPNWWGLGTLWPNSGNDHAIIGSPSGAISLIPGIMANRVTFNHSATVQGNPLALSGAVPELSAQGGATGVVATVVSGSAGLTKQGAGTVILSRTNNYTGVTTIKDGVLQLGDGVSDGALAGSTSIVVSNNGVFGVNFQSSRALAQLISGSGGLLKSGPATLNLTNANTYTGPTRVSAGTLVISNNHASSAHTIASGAVLELNTTAGEKNYGTTIFSGSGTLRKSGANRAYWGANATTFALGSVALIDVQGGTLTAGSNANEDWTANQSDLNVAAGAIFDGVEANVRVDGITGTGTIRTGYGGAGYSTFTIGVANGSSTFDGTIANSISTGNLTKQGSGTITLTKANSYTGTTSVNAGKLRIAHSSALGTSAGGTSVQGGDSSATLELAGTNLVVAGEALTLVGKQGANANTAHLRNVSGTNTWTGAMQTTTGGNMYNLESQAGLLTVSGALNNSLDGRYWQLLGSGDGVVSGVIGGGSSPSSTFVIKSGSGTWTLSAANIYGGLTTVEAGTLKIKNNTALGDASGNTTVATGAKLQLEGANLNVADDLMLGTGSTGASVENVSGNNTLSGAITRNGAVSFLSTAGTLTVLSGIGDTTNSVNLQGNGDGEIRGAITAAYALNKSGAGTWTVSGTNTFVAPTTLSDGKLLVNGSLANGTVTVSGGTLGGQGTINGPVTISGGILEPGVSTGVNETFTINHNLLLGGTARFHIGTSGATPVSDHVVGVTNITYGGTLIVTNVTGATWGGRETFNLFSASGTRSGNFTNIVLQPAVAGIGATFDPVSGTLSLAVSEPPTLGVTNLGGGTMQFSWAGNFKLQSQTNALNAGLGTNWVDYPGGGTSPVNVPIDSKNGSVLFRLISP